MSERKFYDAPRTISYNADLTMIITMRSYGKTYGFIKEAVKDWLRDRSEFVFVRRYDTELKVSMPKLFDSMIEHREFPGYEFKIEGNTGYIRKMAIDGEDENPWNIICHGIPLSKQANYKGVEFPRVKKVIFDEFIRVLKTPPGYLRDDVGAFLDLMKTITRDRDGVHAYLLGNACDLTCPYLAFAGIVKEPRVGYTWYKGKSILVHYAKDQVFAEQERSTIVGRLVDGTPYSTVMIDNEFLNAHDTFIADKTKAAKFRYGFLCQGWTFGVWLDIREGIYYVNRKVPKDGKIFALTSSDMTPNYVMIERSSPFIKQIVRLFSMGVVRFDAPVTRERWLKMMTLYGVR